MSAPVPPASSAALYSRGDSARSPADPTAEDVAVPPQEAPTPAPAALPSGTPAGDVAAESTRALDRAFMHGLAWTAGGRWLAQLLTWGSTLIVARLLSPTDYGLVGMATLYMGFVVMLTEMGFGSAIVVLRNLTDEQISQLNTVSVIAGIGALALSVLLAVPLGHYFGAPNLPPVLIALSSTFVVQAARAVPFALMQRELAFRTLSICDTATAIATAAAAIGIALAGGGYWALALSQIVGAIVSTTLTLLQRRQRFARPRVADLREVLVFSNRMVVGRFAWYFYSNADFLVAGRTLGQAALGTYTFAWTLTTMPGEKIATMLGSLTPAFFSAVQDEREKLRRYLLTLTEGIALLVVPATIGIGMVASELLPLAFGRQWEGAVVITQVLALCTGLRAMRPMLNNALTAVKDTRYMMWIGVGSAVVFPIGFWFGSRWGTLGIASAWAIIYPLQFALGLHRAVALGLVSLREYLSALWPAVSGSSVMALAVWVASRALPPGEFTLGVRAAAEIGVGMMTFAAVVLTLHRERVRRFVRVIRQARSR